MALASAGQTIIKKAKKEKVQNVGKPSMKGALEFIDRYGTHCARSMIFGSAEFETTRFSIDELKQMNEKAVDIKLEAQGSIKGVNVGAEVESGYNRTEVYEQITQRDHKRKNSIGSADSPEPIGVDLRPISELFVPEIFGNRLSPKELADRRALLEEAIDTLFSDADLYPILSRLEIWKVTFRKFTTKQVSHTRSVYGGIKVTRSPQPLQAPDGGLDADYRTAGKGHYIWRRANQDGARVVMNTSGETFPLTVSADLYLILDAQMEEAHLWVTVDLYDYCAGGQNTGPMERRVSPRRICA